MENDVPTNIGRYSVEKLIGQGGMAKVYLGHAQSASGFRKPVALKILQPNLKGDAHFERMLISEATWSGKLHHDGLISVHELGLHEGSYFVCMEYVTGLTLGELCKKIRVSHESAVFFVSRLALALDYMHNYSEGGMSVGLIHRDITPSNVMVSKAGHVKLIDFGIAKATALSSDTTGSLLKGTYVYMSPEQISIASLSPQSDVFSLGALFFELLTGRRAFDAESVHETMRKVAECEWDWGEDSPSAAYQAIVSRCLQKKSEDRFASMAELYRELQALPCRFTPLRLRSEWP